MRRTIQSLKKAVDEHRQKIASEQKMTIPDEGLIHHWQKEITAWEERIARLERRLERRKRRGR